MLHYSILNNTTGEIYCGAGMANSVLRQLYRHAVKCRDSESDTLATTTCNCSYVLPKAVTV